MKQTIILLVCLATVTLAQREIYREDFRRERASSVQEERPPRPIAILRQNSVFNVDGRFEHDFTSENGITEEKSGYIKQVNDGSKSAQTMKGHYAYTAPDGTPIEANWWADETGFHITARHIPTPPPMPEVIAKSLELLPTLPAESESDERTAVVEERTIPKRFRRRLV